MCDDDEEGVTCVRQHQQQSRRCEGQARSRHPPAPKMMHQDRHKLDLFQSSPAKLSTSPPIPVRQSGVDRQDNYAAGHSFRKKVLRRGWASAWRVDCGLPSKHVLGVCSTYVNAQLCRTLMVEIRGVGKVGATLNTSKCGWLGG